MDPDLTLQDIHRAQSTIAQLVHETPLFPTHSLGQLADCHLFLKAENLQRAGSFKIRGATNKIAHLSPALRANGVVAASAGNHAQGVALAARTFGIPCTIVMPAAASIPKVEATRGYGATVILQGKDYAQAQRHAQRVMRERNLTFIHGFDDPAVIAGQGTIGLELLKQMEDVDIVVVPVGGGGLIGGIALAMKETRPGVTVVGVQARASAAFVDSYQAHRRLTVTGAHTIADGIAIGRPGELTFPLVTRYVDDMVVVDEEGITQAMVLLLERCKLLVEGAGAVGLAAVLGGKIRVAGKNVVVVLSGGNVDPNLVARVLEHGLAHAGRYLVLRLLLEDRPGQLSRLLSIVARAQVNVLDISQLRHGPSVPLGHVEVQLTLETRNWAHDQEVRERLREAGYALEEEGAAGLPHA
jgi:threonine dehydratase